MKHRPCFATQSKLLLKGRRDLQSLVMQPLRANNSCSSQDEKRFAYVWLTTRKQRIVVYLSLRNAIFHSSRSWLVICTFSNQRFFFFFSWLGKLALCSFLIDRSYQASQEGLICQQQPLLPSYQTGSVGLHGCLSAAGQVGWAPSRFLLSRPAGFDL